MELNLYKNIHRILRKKIGVPRFCEVCYKEGKLDLANITGVYNLSVENWKYLCRKCHMLSDNRLSNLVQYNDNINKSNVVKKIWNKRSPEERSLIAKKGWITKKC